MGWLDDEEYAAGSAHLRAWRATTAIRIFGLSLVVGLVLVEGFSAQSGPPLLLLALVSVLCLGIEGAALPRALPWVPVAEALLVALILASTPAPLGAVAYLAVPPIVSGVRHGIVTTVNTAIVGALAAVATLTVGDDTGAAASAGQLLPWVLTGLGVGLLASWQSRSVRELETRQAPYAAAYQLLSQLHDLTHRGEVGLDVGTLAERLDSELREASGATDSVLLTDRPDTPPSVLTTHGDSGDLARCADPSTSAPLPDDVHVVALTGAEHRVGRAVLRRRGGWTPELRRAAAAVADEYSMPLDTALMFDSVRQLATTEERNRIAREMHDGVAQEVVALGYVADEIESTSHDPETRALAASMRQEITRLVAELRFSIFDLRHAVVDGHLAGALADYVREASRDSDLRVHLTLDESGRALPSRTQTEVLRIAQEAVGNVRRHSSADNLWVDLTTDGVGFELVIADDGVGNAVPRERHWGLQTMHERATRLGASLTVTPHHPTGTRVRLVSHCTSSEGTHP